MPLGTRRARGYVAAVRARARAAALADAVWAGLWLGLFRREDLHAVDGAFYDAQALYRDEAHNRRGLLRWERRALGEHFPAQGRLLVLGAGGGRELLPLAAAGYAVEGFECNPTLVAVAERLLAEDGAHAARVRPIARDAAPEGEGPFDGVIVGWGSYMLIAGRARRVAFLRALRREVRDDAPVLLSFFTRPGRGWRAGVVHAVARTLRRLRGDEPPDLGDDLAPNFVHRFTEAEIRAELAEGGFALVDFEPQGRGAFDSGNAVARAAPAATPAPSPAESPAASPTR